MTINIRIPLLDGSWQIVNIPLSDEQYTLAAIVEVISDEFQVLDKREVYINRARKPRVVISSSGS